MSLWIWSVRFEYYEDGTCTRVEGPCLFSSEAKAETFARDVVAEWALAQLEMWPEYKPAFLNEDGELNCDPLKLIDSELNNHFCIFLRMYREKVLVDSHDRAK